MGWKQWFFMGGRCRWK